MEIDRDALVNYMKLVHEIALVSSKSFLQLYELVTKSSDKKLKKEAKKLFGATVVKIAVALNKIKKYDERIVGNNA